MKMMIYWSRCNWSPFNGSTINTQQRLVKKALLTIMLKQPIDIQMFKTRPRLWKMRPRLKSRELQLPFGHMLLSSMRANGVGRSRVKALTLNNIHWFEQVPYTSNNGKVDYIITTMTCSIQNDKFIFCEYSQFIVDWKTIIVCEYISTFLACDCPSSVLLWYQDGWPRVTACDWNKPGVPKVQLDGWLGFNGILSTQVAAISCLRKFKVY